MNFKTLMVTFAMALIPVCAQASFFDLNNFAFTHSDHLYRSGLLAKVDVERLEQKIKEVIPHESKEDRAERREYYAKEAESIRVELYPLHQEVLLKGLVYGSIVGCVGSLVAAAAYTNSAQNDNCDFRVLMSLSKYLSAKIDQAVIDAVNRSYWQNMTISISALIGHWGSIFANTWAAKKLAPSYGKRDVLNALEKAIALIDEIDAAEAKNVA